jgi:hypothetical protein
MDQWAVSAMSRWLDRLLSARHRVADPGHGQPQAAGWAVAAWAAGALALIIVPWPALALQRVSHPTPVVQDPCTQWLSLRQTKGRFDGAEWNDAVDRWHGQKHALMMLLTQQLQDRQANGKTVLKCLGQPEVLARPGRTAHHLLLQKLFPGEPDTSNASASKKAARHTEFWLYSWRGQHDQLVLHLHQGRLTGSAWLYGAEQ